MAAEIACRLGLHKFKPYHVGHPAGPVRRYCLRSNYCRGRAW